MVILTGKPDLATLPLNILLVLALIPFVRYVIGFKHWRNYSTLSFALSAFLLISTFKNATTGIVFWLYFILLAVIFATMTRILLKSARLHYFARIALIYTGGIIGVLTGAVITSKLTPFNPFKFNFSSLSLVLIITALDDLTILQLRKDALETVRRLGTTIILALASAFLFMYKPWIMYLYYHQEIVAVIIAAMIIIGQWKYINLVDILRFKSILDEKQE